MSSYLLDTTLGDPFTKLGSGDPGGYASMVGRRVDACPRGRYAAEVGTARASARTPSSRRHPNAGTSPRGALPGEGDVARLRARNLHQRRGARPAAGRAAWQGSSSGGHTDSRNLGGADWDWETDAGRHRTWIRQQDSEFLRRTGLAQVIARHGAQYLNVTEAWWDGACAPEEHVRAALGNVALHHPDLAGFVPSILMELRGTPMLSLARLKGPTRLGISNLFGLIPHPMRSAWHGPNITFFSSVCCDLARLYGSLFPLFGLVEAFESAVRWDRKGLYRSRWGNYDLVLTDGLFTLSEGLAGADLIASRLQGKDVLRSGFFDVVRARLPWPTAAETAPLPVEVQSNLA